jgi:reverse gyrase
MQFTQASESFKKANPHIFAEGTLGQVLLEPKERPLSKEEIKNEKQLQNQIASHIENTYGALVIRSRTDRKTTTNVGVPDLLFSLRPKGQTVGVPIAFEVKLPGKEPTEEQHKMMLRMTGSGWLCYVVDDYDVAKEIARNIIS